jgi:CubicO group peptidase (beta-lactamase class C family)
MLLITSSCINPSTQEPVYWPTDGWKTSTPEEQGMDSELLAEMVEIIQEENYQIDSVTIIRNGYLVTDILTLPAGSTHIIYSCTKSVVSILVGIAIDQGYIESVDQPVVDFFPSRTIANLDDYKKGMTLEHLLTMTSGLDCRDSYLYRWQGLGEMQHSDDWVQYVLDLPMIDEPGKLFEYCNGASNLLSAIVQETTGMSSLEFAKENLFSPLGISDVEWASDPQGVTIGYSELRMLPHDMAKIGYLYLNEGIWNGEQIVSSEWVEVSTREHIAGTMQDGYGYQWWVDDSGFYLALGYRGQFIYVVPEMNMVVAFTSHLPDYNFYVPQGLLTDYIIPAVQSTSPLPENPEGNELLTSQIEALVNP